jgi:hypothetical protein
MNTRLAREHFALQVVLKVSRTHSVVYVRTRRKTEILRLRYLIVMKNLAVRAVVDGKHIGILRSQVVVRGRSVQAENTD